VKNRGVLYFLAVGVLSAAPALADKVPNTAKEQGGNSVAIHELLYGSFLEHAGRDRDLGVGAFSEAAFAPRLNDFTGDGKASILDELSSSKLGKINSEGRPIVLGMKPDDPLGKSSDGDRRKHNPITLEGDGSSLAAAAVPELDSFTLVLFGLGVLGILLYRRNSP